MEQLLTLLKEHLSPLELRSLKKISRTRRHKMSYAWPRSVLVMLMKSSKMNGSKEPTSLEAKS